MPSIMSTMGAAAVMAFVATALAAAPANSALCNAKTAPIQIRLAYAGHDGMAVSWNTNEQLAKPTVYFGKDNRKLHRFASSQISTTYPTSATWNNHVVIKGLEPDTTYYYQPQCGDQTYTFKTPRPAGEQVEFNFAMVGDMGTFGPDGLSTTVGKGASNPLLPGQLTTVQSLADFKNSYEFIWHGSLLLCKKKSRLSFAHVPIVGDLAYADAWIKEEKSGYITPLNETDGGAEYDKILNDFYGEIEVLSSTRPYMVAAGQFTLHHLSFLSLPI